MGPLRRTANGLEAKAAVLDMALSITEQAKQEATSIAEKARREAAIAKIVAEKARVAAAQAKTAAAQANIAAAQATAASVQSDASTATTASLPDSQASSTTEYYDANSFSNQADEEEIDYPQLANDIRDYIKEIIFAGLIGGEQNTNQWTRLPYWLTVDPHAHELADDVRTLHATLAHLFYLEDVPNPDALITEFIALFIPKNPGLTRADSAIMPTATEIISPIPCEVNLDGLTTFLENHPYIAGAIYESLDKIREWNGIYTAYLESPIRERFETQKHRHEETMFRLSKEDLTMRDVYSRYRDSSDPLSFKEAYRIVQDINEKRASGFALYNSLTGEKKRTARKILKQYKAKKITIDQFITEITAIQDDDTPSLHRSDADVGAAYVTGMWKLVRTTNRNGHPTSQSTSRRSLGNSS